MLLKRLHVAQQMIFHRSIRAFLVNARSCGIALTLSVEILQRFPQVDSESNVDNTAPLTPLAKTLYCYQKDARRSEKDLQKHPR